MKLGRVVVYELYGVMMRGRSYTKFLRIHPVISVFTAVLLLMAAFVARNNVYHANKVKDPNDPRFDPMAYRFEDYTNPADSQRALERIFPVGTPRAKVDEFLVNKMGAKAYSAPIGIKPEKIGTYNIYYKVPYNPLFCEGPPIKTVILWPLYVGGRSVDVTYGSDNKVVAINSMIP